MLGMVYRVLELVLVVSLSVSLVLGAEGSFLSSGTSIHVGEDRVSAFPALSYRFFLGIQASVLP